MARVVLHIGTHKTGSTTFQDMMAHNARDLARRGVFYPKVGRIAGHHGMVGDWNPCLPEMYHWRHGSVGTLKRLAAEYARQDGVMILSTEELSRAEVGRSPDLAVVRDLLSGFERIDVVCVLREQWQFLQSVWLEVSRQREPWPPTWTANGAMGTDQAEGLWVDYGRLYDSLLEVFPADRIHFLDFDQARKSDGGLVPAILRAAGVTDPLPLKDVHGGHSNPSPPALPSWIAAQVDRPEPPGPGLVTVMHEAFCRHFGDAVRSCLFSREEMAKLKLHFGHRNEEFRNRLATVQPGFALSVTDPPAGTVFRDDMTEEVWIACLTALRQARRS